MGNPWIWRKNERRGGGAPIRLSYSEILFLKIAVKWLKLNTRHFSQSTYILFLFFAALQITQSYIFAG